MNYLSTLKDITPNVKRTATDISLDELNIIIHEMCSISVIFKDCVKHYKFSPARSPTVPIFWFINKAYTANHYYTLLSDYVSTVMICDEMVNAYNASEGNQWLAEQSLPAFLTTQWIDMYDRELQQMLGLSALCRLVLHGADNRSVHIPICPVQFAHYFKARCLFEQSLHPDDERSDDEYLEHNFYIYTERTYFSFGSLCLTNALRTATLRRGMTV